MLPLHCILQAISVHPICIDCTVVTTLGFLIGQLGNETPHRFAESYCWAPLPVPGPTYNYSVSCSCTWESSNRRPKCLGSCDRINVTKY